MLSNIMPGRLNFDARTFEYDTHYRTYATPRIKIVAISSFQQFFRAEQLEARPFKVESNHLHVGGLFADSRLSWSAGARRSNSSIHGVQKLSSVPHQNPRRQAFRAGCSRSPCELEGRPAVRRVPANET
jgi:hypothetical protein